MSSGAPSAPASRSSRAPWVVAVAYGLALTILWALLRWLGERWWVTALLLYVPRLLWALPLLALAPWAALRAPRALLWIALDAWLAVVVLGGWELPPLRAAAAGPTLRVMSHNANQCAGSFGAMIERATSSGADVVLMQEVCLNGEYVVEALRAKYGTARQDGEFLIASRLPLVSVRPGAPSPLPGGTGAVRHVRYELQSEWGPIAVYNVHPTSPRPAWLALLELVRAHALHEPAELLARARRVVDENSALRADELELAAASARAEPMPVLIAGDTNLPTLSPLLRTTLAGFRDGFRERGTGFGFTYPGRAPFLRIDRVMASDELCFTRHLVACRELDDHLCVHAELTPCALPPGR